MKCDKCENDYFQKECPYCSGLVKAVSNNNNATSGQKATIIILVMALMIASVIIYSMNFSNPIIGKWRSEKAIPFMGHQTIEFTSNRMVMMGITSEVDYEVEGNKVIVTDATGTGIIFKVINDNKIKSELMGLGGIYKRVQ